MAEMVYVVNLAEIERAMARSGPLVLKGMRLGLRAAAEPVRRDADRLAQTQISGMRRAKRKPPPWSVQKIGQNMHEVYIVPKEKGTRGDPRSRRSRPNFATLMLGRAYDPALERNQVLVRETVDASISRAIGEV